jgi:hypothetical protein
MRSPGDFEVDLSAIRSDLRDMERDTIEQRKRLDQGRVLQETHKLESEVELEVPEPAADHVRAVVRESTGMSVDEHNLFLYDALVAFEERTTRYVFPNGDVLEAGPDSVVFTPASDG